MVADVHRVQALRGLPDKVPQWYPTGLRLVNKHTECFHSSFIPVSQILVLELGGLIMSLSYLSD